MHIKTLEAVRALVTTHFNECEQHALMAILSEEREYFKGKSNALYRVLATLDDLIGEQERLERENDCCEQND